MSGVWVLLLDLLKLDFLVSLDNIHTSEFKNHWWHFFIYFVVAILNLKMATNF